MSSVQGLFLALLALHVIEGVLWVRRSASAFVRSWSRRHRALDTVLGPYGNAESCFLLLSPWPPFSEIAVAEPWPLIFGAEHLHGAEVERPPRARLIERGARTADAADAARAAVEGKVVNVGPLTAATSSPPAARALAALVQRWAAAPPAERPALIDAALEARFDRAAVRARWAQLETSGWLLRGLAHLGPLLLFGGAYTVFYLPQVDERIVLAALAVVMVASWIELFRLHRKLHPELGGDRAMKLFLVITSVPAIARTRAWIARDALADFHPLAVAEALLDREDFLRWAGPRWRDLRFPLGPEPPELAVDAAAARARVVVAYRRLFAEIGVDPATLEAGPAGADAYCPRCHAEYRRAEGECPDCPGVHRAVGVTPARPAATG